MTAHPCAMFRHILSGGLISTLHHIGGNVPKQLKPSDIPADYVVQPLKVGETVPSTGVHATCGTCGLSWDDGVSTRITPTPSARCPFETFHTQPKRETYAQAKVRLLQGLSIAGWRLGDLKLPHAISSDQKIRLWFRSRPQSIYYTYAICGPHVDRFIWSSIGDYRGLTIESLLQEVKRWGSERAIPSTTHPGKIKVSKPKRETYQAARTRLLRELIARGWVVMPDLKIPWANKGDLRLNFHPQAVYLWKHSLFLDIRGMTVESFLQRVDVVYLVRQKTQ